MIPDISTVLPSKAPEYDLHRSASSELPFSPMPQDSTNTDTTRSRDSSKDVNADYDTVDPANQNAPYFVPTNNIQANQNNYVWQQPENTGQWNINENNESGYDRIDQASQQYENTLHPVDDGMVNYSDNSSYVAESPRYDPNQYEPPQEVYPENETYQEDSTQNNDHYTEDNDHQNAQKEEQQANVFTPYYPTNESTQNDEQNYTSQPMFYNTPQNNSFNSTYLPIKQ